MIPIRPMLAMALVALCFQQDPTETIPPASLPASARAPRPADGRVQVAMRAYEQRDYQRAERELRAGLEIEPERADILVRLGIVLYRMKRWGDAIPYLTKGVEKEQNSLGDMQVIGHCYYELGQTEEALDWYNRVIAAKKTNREAWRGKGFALERLGKYPEAEEALRTAVALNPDSAPAHLWLGRVLTKQKKAGAAIPYLEKAKKLNAFDWETEYELSRAYLALGETARSRASKERSDFLRGHAERINELKSKLLSSPRDIGIITLLAAQYDAIGDVLNAKQAWDQARNLSRDDPAVTIAHAASLFATGAGATAEELLRAKLRERPADPTLWEVLWYVLRERGDQKGAAEAASRVKQILNRDPQVPEIFAKKPEPPASSPAPPGDRKDD